MAGTSAAMTNVKLAQAETTLARFAATGETIAYCVPASPACTTTLPQRSFSVAMNFGSSANGGLTTGTTPVRLTAC